MLITRFRSLIKRFIFEELQEFGTYRWIERVLLPARRSSLTETVHPRLFLPMPSDAAEEDENWFQALHLDSVSLISRRR